ncbi:MAG: RDD family protein [Woeseiaceae bacterium]|nr:RDD family protein [Woeseiaceae bacterium]
MSDENLYSAPDADVDIPLDDEQAGRGARLIAVIIDGLLIVVVALPLMFMLGLIDTAATGPAPGTSIASMFLGIAAFILINGYFLASSGPTVGKKVMGIRIVAVQDGKILHLGKVVGLSFLPVWIVQSIPLIGALLGLINALFIFREDRRCIHDLIAGTHVVRA